MGYVRFSHNVATWWLIPDDVSSHPSQQSSLTRNCSGCSVSLESCKPHSNLYTEKVRVVSSWCISNINRIISITHSAGLQASFCKYCSWLLWKQCLMTTTSAPHDCRFCMQTHVSQYINIYSSASVEDPSGNLYVLLELTWSATWFLAESGGGRKPINLRGVTPPHPKNRQGPSGGSLYHPKTL